MDRDFSCVIGSGVLAFASEIQARDRQAITLALRFAHRAAQDLYEEAEDDWFQYYRRQLRFLGWDAQPALISNTARLQGLAITERAREHMQAQGTHFAALGGRGLKALARSPNGMKLLEQFARRHRHGMFQLFSCRPGKAPSGVPVIDLVVYHEELDLGASKGWFLDDTALPLRQAYIGLVRFDVRSFERTHMPKIAQRFERFEGDYLAML